MWVQTTKKLRAPLTLASRRVVMGVSTVAHPAIIVQLLLSMSSLYAEVSRLNLSSSRSPGIACLAFSPDGVYLAGGDFNGTISIWSMRDYSLLHYVESPSAVLSISWTPTSESVLTAISRMPRSS